MRWKEIVRPLSCVLLLLAAAGHSHAAESRTVRTLVPTFGGSTSLGANVSTILALRLWTTLRPRPNPNPDNLYFGVGQIEWSRRVIEPSPESALNASLETSSDLALWGAVEEYGPGVVVTSNLIISTNRIRAADSQLWNVGTNVATLRLGLPNISYQFSPMVLSKEVLAKYSRPNQIRVCTNKSSECTGAPLGNPFRAIRMEGDFTLVRQSTGNVGWVALPNLSEAQGEVVSFTAALISYLRGDFEQAETYFSTVRDSKADRLVQNDAALLAGISSFRRKKTIEGLQAAHQQNPYSRFGVQALVMANVSLASDLDAGEARNVYSGQARQLMSSYRHLFAPDDAWLVAADLVLRSFN